MFARAAGDEWNLYKIFITFMPSYSSWFHPEQKFAHQIGASEARTAGVEISRRFERGRVGTILELY